MSSFLEIIHQLSVSTMELPSYMTTPELRVGPPPPYTNTPLHINLFFRVFLGILGNMCCWVPMRLLWKNGEFSASIYCVAVMTLNCYYIVNALIWRDDNVKEWYAGYGWCDLQMYTVFAIQTLYSACIFAIMRNLANKVGMMRATSLTAREKRRRNLFEALIIFPFPFLQVVMTYFVLAQRYNVSTLIGCTNFYYRTWPYLIIYHIPTNAYTLLTVFYGGLTWFRFRQVEKMTMSARGNTSNPMQQRHQRIRRKLYFMCMSTMVLILPLQMFFLYTNIAAGLDNLMPYDFAKIHNPATFNLITFKTTPGISFLEMNSNYVAIVTCLPLFWFFGLTKEAINTYRVYSLNLGLGILFPRLHEEYDPDRSRNTNQNMSWRQKISGVLKSGDIQDSSHKNSILPTFQHVSNATTTSSTTTGDLNTVDEAITPAPPPKFDSTQWPDLTIPEPASRHFSNRSTADGEIYSIHLQHRNPFIFRTMLSSNPFHLFTRSRGTNQFASAPPEVPLSDYGRRPQHSASDTKSLVGARVESRDGDANAPWTVSNSNAVGGNRASKGGTPKVQTKVWHDEELLQRAATDANSRNMDMDEIGVAVAGDSTGVRVDTRIARREENI